MAPPSDDHDDRGPEQDALDGPILEAPLDPHAALFALARTHFVAGQGRAGGSLLLFVTLVFFVLAAGPGATPSSIAILVVVLLVHELGHYLGMRVFGYRDVRMFFVPFLGAAVSGRRGSIAAWKDAVVLLLGPLPGVLLGASLLFASTRWPLPALVQTAETMLLINAFNLLPFGALDGGKLLLRVVFARHRYLELAFGALGSLALAGVAIALSSVALGVFALLGLAALGRRSKILEAAARVSPNIREASAESLDDAGARRLFDEAHAILTPPASADPRAIGLAMEDILLAAQRPPGLLASTLLVSLWGAACFVALVASAALVVALAPADWQRRTLTVSSVEIPGEPHRLDEPWATPAGQRTAEIRVSWLDVVERFTAIEIDAGAELAPADRDVWNVAMRERLEEQIGDQGAELVSERPVQWAGHAAVETSWRSGWRVWHARTLVEGRHVIILVASSPEDSANASRFLDSLQLTSAQPAQAPR